MRLLYTLPLVLAVVTDYAQARLASENGHNARRSLALHGTASNRRRDQIIDHNRLGKNGGEEPLSFAAQNITWSTTPFNPTGIPLAVRSPYLSTWLWGGTHDRFGDLTAQQPSFWNGMLAVGLFSEAKLRIFYAGNILPWCGTVMVDGIVYTWMGVPAQCAPGGRTAVQQSLNFTASQTTFTFTAGGANLRLVHCTGQKKLTIVHYR